MRLAAYCLIVVITDQTHNMILTFDEVGRKVWQIRKLLQILVIKITVVEIGVEE